MNFNRRIERLVNSERFRKACEVATEDQLAELDDVIPTMNSGELKRWLRRIYKRDLHDYPVKQLRVIGRRYGIFHWNNMTKVDLIEAIEHERRKRVIEGKDHW